MTGISTSFLNFNTSRWSVNSDYLIGLNIVKNFVVSNNVAEEQKQLIFKEVLHHRQKFPTGKKSE